VKKICFIALLALAGGWILRAQTNAPNTNAVAEILALVTTNAPAPQPQPPRAPTRIDSDSADFDLNGHKAIYRGNVRVDDPQIKLTCEFLVADLPQSGGRINHIVAETNVVIDTTDEKGATNHVTSDKAVYDYNVQGTVTNETITLTGSPQVENAQGTQSGDVIIWDRANKHIRFVNPIMVSGRSLGSAMGETNSAAAKTNNPPAPKLF
jgi:lipopolysaccharide transport protein LptA